MAEYFYTSAEHSLNFISDDGRINQELELLSQQSFSNKVRKLSVDSKNSVIKNVHKHRNKNLETDFSALRFKKLKILPNVRDIYPAEGYLNLGEEEFEYVRGVCSSNRSKLYWTLENGRTSNLQWNDEEKMITIYQGEEIVQEVNLISEIADPNLRSLFFYNPDIEGNIIIHLKDSDDLEQMMKAQIHVIGPYDVFDRNDIIEGKYVYQSTINSHVEGVIIRKRRSYDISTSGDFGKLLFDKIDKDIHKLMIGEAVNKQDQNKIILFLKNFNKSKTYFMNGSDGPNFYSSKRTKSDFQNKYGVNLTTEYDLSEDYPLLVNQFYDNAGFIAINATRTSELGYPQLMGSENLVLSNTPNIFSIESSSTVISTILSYFYDDNKLTVDLINEATSDINKMRLFNIKTEKGVVSHLNFSMIDAILRHYNTCFCFNWCEEMGGLFAPNTRLGASIILGLFSGNSH